MTTAPTTSIERVTPPIAEQWLSKNVKNRTIRAGDVDRYARDMGAGDWRMTGEPVKFSRRGTLLDGQHRLSAIVQAGVAVELLIVRGLDDETQSVMDTGTKRTAADALTLLGEAHPPMIAAAARIALSDIATTPTLKTVTHSEIFEFVSENPTIRDACAFVMPLARRIDCPPAVAAYTLFELAKIDTQGAYQFWTDAVEKVGLVQGDPIIALTDRFSEARRRRERLTRQMYVSAIYRAWNARRTGTQLRLVKLHSASGGAVAVPAPR